ncbi:MmcQ/YjbR family DNA-binding protein [uncultured Duncaniella sp.]|uniref:MmcQ/YjbR family DNA-binding protein n=1 Tax=uncultured Duncaniella sp. TaxID=2768039 RepID=UPI0025E7699A|nr:MmcQ/YjbR family DNA-binding protein [uncultured Duncaniella sp.]
MNVEEFREFCLSLGDVTEKMPFGKFAARYDSILAFYVSGHMFCFIDIDDFNYVDVKSTPERIEELRRDYTSVGNPINQSLRHWIKLYFDGDIPLSVITDSVRNAYGIIKAKYAPKPRWKP